MASSGCPAWTTWPTLMPFLDTMPRTDLGTHVAQLRFLVVRRHPHVVDLDDGEQRLPGLDDLADVDAVLGHDAAHRSRDACRAAAFPCSSPSPTRRRSGRWRAAVARPGRPGRR